jgi:hypothetical protein
LVCRAGWSRGGQRDRGVLVCRAAGPWGQGRVRGGWSGPAGGNAEADEGAVGGGLVGPVGVEDGCGVLGLMGLRVARGRGGLRVELLVGWVGVEGICL